MPISVTCIASLVTKLYGCIRVSTGASNVNAAYEVPTTPETDSIIDRVPVPPEVRHSADVTNAHVVVSQVVLERRMVGVVP